MLENERLIYKMSIEQKVKLVTSLNLYENSADENYEFPVFKVTRNPLEGSTGIFATQFPSDRALASAWNPSLISEVYKKRGEEAFAVKPYSYFNVTDDIAAEGVSEDYFLSAKSLAAKISGLAEVGQFVNFEEVADGNDRVIRNFRDLLLNNSAPVSVFAKSPEKTENALVFCAAESVDEALNCLFNGCVLIFLKSDFTAELISRLEKLTVDYRAAYASYRADEITVTELDRRCQSLEIFDESILDNACDRLISALLNMRELSRKPVFKNGLNMNRLAKFDEIADNDLALVAARQSVVLLKNEGALPLSATEKVAVLGECAKDFSYQSEFFSGSATRESTPFSEINGYDINAVGFASGYARAQSGNRELTDTALELAKEAGTALVYLSAEKGEKSLPAGQSELIDALYNSSVKIIAVVASDGNVDLGFADKCAAVLLTYRAGQEGARAVLDVLKGIATPSGRLTEAISPRYPFGYGLTYTRFEYSNLKINERGISCTVKNVGSFGGFAVPQFYLQKPLSDGFFKQKLLRGFQKVYVKKGDATRVEIPFDSDTFKVFDEKSGLYRIEGGEYTVSVGENFDDIRLAGTVTLSEFVFKDGFKNEIVETVTDGSNVKFDVNQEPPEVRKAKKKLPFGLKLFVALLLFAYYEGIMAALAFTDIVSVKDVVFYAVIGALAGACLVAFIVYVVIIAKNRKKQRYVPVNDVLTDLVENVKEFDEIAKVTYIDPLAEEPEEEEPEPDALPAVTVEEVREETYDLSFTEGEELEVEHVTFNEICSNFQSFVRRFGVQVDIASVRSLIAAVSASKIVVVSSKNTEVLPEFLTALSEYFHSGKVTSAGTEWGAVTDLLWKRDGDKFAVSDFVNSVYSATKATERLCAAVIDGVKAENLTAWFAPFIRYANHPTEEHILTLNEELSFRLPDNFVYFLSPAEGCGNFPREVADACLQLDLALIKCDNGEEVEAKNIPNAELCDLVKESRESYFMSEKVYKKFDELFETVRASEKFGLGNKNTLQLEKFTSVLLECGGDETECVNNIFLAKIVPLLKLTRMYLSDGGEKTVFGLIEKLFGEEDLTKIQRALSKAVVNV